MKNPQTLFAKLHATRCCPYWMPWFSGSRDIRKLKKIALGGERLLRAKGSTGFLGILRAGLWPFISFFQAVENARSSEAMRLASMHGQPSILRQLLHQITLANRHNISPYCYFQYRFYDAANRQRAAQYFVNPPFARLLDVLSGDVDIKLLRDKYAFFKRGQLAGLPMADVIATVDSSGVVHWAGDSRCLPYQDLFLKPRGLSQGQGAERWCYKSGSWFRQGRELKQKEMFEYVRTLAKDCDYLIMPALAPHPELLNFTSGALPTLRVVTCNTPGQPVVVIMSIFRMPVHSADVDNFHAGGIAAPIDKEGKLGEAIGSETVGMTHDTHPSTGKRIVGVRLPYIDGVHSTCRRAHEFFYEVPAIGWDVAITPNGPILIEANAYWDSALQAVCGQPLAETPFVSWALSQHSWLQKAARNHTQIQASPPNTPH